MGPRSPQGAVPLISSCDQALPPNLDLAAFRFHLRAPFHP